MPRYYTVTSLEVLKPRLRVLPILLASASVSVFAWIVVTQRGTTRTICIIGFVTIVILGTVRFYKEQSIVQNLGSSIGLVVERRKTPSSDGGGDYEATYEFTDADGKAYVGKSGGTIKELPETGSPIQILYAKGSPTQNLPRELFWFYKI
jgi:hypothetical protein